MIVEVRLFAHFRKGRFNEKQVELREGGGVSDLLGLLKIPVKDAKVLIVNGVRASADDNLSDGDVIAIFPPIAGG